MRSYFIGPAIILVGVHSILIVLCVVVRVGTSRAHVASFITSPGVSGAILKSCGTRRFERCLTFFLNLSSAFIHNIVSLH